MVLLLALGWLAGAWAAEAPTPPSAPAPAGPGVVADRVAAVVNDEIVTLTEVYELGASYIEEAVVRDGEAARGRAEREVLERLIERRLVGQEMATLRLDVTDQDLDRAIDDVARRNGLDRDTLREEIERSGMSWDQYRAELKENLRDMKFAQAVIRPRITITEDELKDAFLRATQGAPAAAHVQALFLAFPPDADEAAKQAVREKAAALRAEAAGGADFGALSKQHDQGPFGERGGEMGTFRPGELREDLDAAVRATAVGEVSPPVETSQGVFLLRVAERSSGGGDFEAMRDQIADNIFAARLEDEKERWFQQARRRAAVRVLLADTDAPPGRVQPAP